MERVLRSKSVAFCKIHSIELFFNDEKTEEDFENQWFEIDAYIFFCLIFCITTYLKDLIAYSDFDSKILFER